MKVSLSDSTIPTSLQYSVQHSSANSDIGTFSPAYYRVILPFVTFTMHSVDVSSTWLPNHRPDTDTRAATLHRSACGVRAFAQLHLVHGFEAKACVDVSGVTVRVNLAAEVEVTHIILLTQ